MHPSTHTVIVITGPTAVGKTAVAVALARQLGTVVISADSRQCYRELAIGVARPLAEELAAVKHYFIASHSIQDEVNAGVFEKYALQATAEIFAQHKTCVMVGGTGLYIRAFCGGMDQMPAIPVPIRQQVITAYEKEGLGWLQQELQQHDPIFWQGAEQQNPQRLMRALEVILATGKSISFFRTAKQVQRPFRIVMAGLELPRDVLHRHINTRVDQMMDAGLLDEVRSVYPFKHLNALQTVGYQELFDYLDGKCSLDEAVSRIRQNTRRYAKRQMTWFKKDSNIHWINAAEVNTDMLVSLMNAPSAENG